MPRLAHSLPKYRKHRPSGQAVVTMNGHDFYLGPHGTRASKFEYDRLIGEWLQQGRQIQLAAGTGGLTIVELLAAYLRHAKRYYRKDGRPTSEVASIMYAVKYVRLLYGRKPVIEFGPIALQATLQRMVDDRLTRGTINQHAGRIKRIFKWGAAQELIPGTIYHALSSVAGLRKGRTEAKESTPVMPVSDSTVDATLPHLPEVVADMVRLQRLTGMRPAEVCILRPMDLDRSGEVWMYTPESHKTEHHGRDRVVFIGPQAQGVLLKYLARDSSMYCFRPVDSEAKRRAGKHAARTVPLHYGNRPGTNRKSLPKRTAGDRYDANAYRRAIHRACDRAFVHPHLSSCRGAELAPAQRAELQTWQSAHRWSPNRLRHAAATEIRRRFGLEAAQVILGHSAADITQVYAERDRTKGVEVAQLIG